MPSGLKKNEKIITMDMTDKKGQKIGTVKRIGKLVKTLKYSNSKYQYKVKVAPRTYIYLEEF